MRPYNYSHLTISLFLVCSCIVLSEVSYHITPTAVNVLCPAEPCLTLSQFAANFNNYLNSSITLIFLSGKHNLESDLLVANISKLTLQSNFKHTIIFCELQMNLDFHFIDQISINGLEFEGCTSMIAFADQVTIEESTFTGAAGTALELIKCTVSIVKSSFIFNSAQGSLGIGGAISAVSSNLTITGSIFEGNSAEAGGVMYVDAGNTIVSNSTFFNNYVMTLVLSDEPPCSGSVFYLVRSTLMISCSIFYNNTAEGEESSGGVFEVEVYSIVNIYQCIFVHNKAKGQGGVLSAHFATVIISMCEFSNNLADTGGVLAVETTTVLLNRSMYYNNRANESGVMDVYQSLIFIREGNCFTNNTAHRAGGVLQLYSSNMTVFASEFMKNTAIRGGSMDIVNSWTRIHSTVSISESKFINNTAESGAVIFAVSNSNLEITINKSIVVTNIASRSGTVYANGLYLNISTCEFRNNSAFQGGVLYIISSISFPAHVTITSSRFSNNVASQGGTLFASSKSVMRLQDVDMSSNSANLGVVYMIESTGLFSGNTKFFDNVGSLFVVNSNVSFSNYSKFICCSSPKTNDTAGFQEAGAVTAFRSEIHFYGTSWFMYNQADIGGALFITDSKLYVYREIVIANNTATKTGGGMFLYQSELNFQGNSTLNVSGNNATIKGGGIHATSSSIKLEFYTYTLKHRSTVYFTENWAKRGGGLFLEVNAKLYIMTKALALFQLPGHHTLVFTANSADYGGAVYVADETASATCESISYRIHSTATECFVQALSLSIDKIVVPYSYIHFRKNLAHYSGSILFGGLLDRCTLSPFAKAYGPGDSETGPDLPPINLDSWHGSINGVPFTITDSELNTSISSYPVRICFCCNNGQPDCSYHPPRIQVKKGEQFTVTLVAVDQINSTVGNTTIRTSLSSQHGGLGEGQHNQTVIDGCTELKFNAFSPHPTEELVMYADGPCKDAPLSQRRIPIQFSPCSCPIGFQSKGEETKCDCECDSTIQEHITDCDPQTKTLVREGNFWITFINITNNLRDYHYLIYPHCPLDYCHPADSRIRINLNVLNGADAQCAYDHSGTLCGSCMPGHSLSLGSSHCIVCPSYWPALLAAILIAALLAGIALVALILMINLTVAVGTLNGIIFYANVIHANKSTFLPFKKPNIISMFISWLNLELGFDTCLFKGMDAYWKTLLQLAFPVYLISLVVIIIIISERSTKFAQLIGKKNPVATLDTIVLLSYTKFLNVIIASLSIAVLDYPDASQKVVWLLDANILYLSGRLFILFLIAFPILLVGVAYTTVLFSWQWLLHHQSKKLFMWVRNQRLYMFLEPYHAPYTSNHRYWTGLLLLLRAILYTISTANVSSDPRINLLAIGIVMTALLLLKGYSQERLIYRKWLLDVLEMSCYINIILLCLSEFFCLERSRKRNVIAYISGSHILVLLVAVLTYHIFMEFIFKSKYWKGFRRYKQRNCSPLEDDQLKESEFVQPNVTHSEVDGPAKNDLPLSALIEVDDSLQTTSNQQTYTATDDDTCEAPYQCWTTDHIS